MTIDIEGRPVDNPAAAPTADTYIVRPDYFATMRIPVLAGRPFESSDRGARRPSPSFSRTMADELWPGEDPIGRRIRVPGNPNGPLRTIVGIVGDVKQYGVHMPVTRQAYVPHAQPPFGPQRFMTVVVRTAAERDPLSLASTVRERVRSIDALQPVTRVQTFDEIIAQSLATRRFTLPVARLVRWHRGAACHRRSVRRPRLHRQPAVSGYRRSHGVGRQRTRDQQPGDATGNDVGHRWTGIGPGCQYGDRPRHRVHVVRHLVSRFHDVRYGHHDNGRGRARRVHLLTAGQ
jgi:hypothetical protein